MCHRFVLSGIIISDKMPVEKRSKRIRVNFNSHQIDAMEQVFRKTQYPDPKILSILSEKLEIPMEKICTWFQNRRSKFRRESKDGHIDWMRQQLFCEYDPGGLGLVDHGGNPLPPPPPGAGTVPRPRVSPPVNHLDHALSPPVTPGTDNSPGEACPSQYKMPTANYHYRPQWTPLTPPGPLHAHTPTDAYPSYHGYQSHHPNITTTSSASGYRGNRPDASGFSDFLLSSGGSYQPYGTLISACNPAQAQNSACAYAGASVRAPDTGNVTKTPTLMTSSPSYLDYENSRWDEQYGGPQPTPYNTNAYNSTTYHVQA